MVIPNERASERQNSQVAKPPGRSLRLGTVEVAPIDDFSSSMIVQSTFVAGRGAGSEVASDLFGLAGSRWFSRLFLSPSFK